MKATPKQIFARKRNFNKRQLMGMAKALENLDTLSNTERRHAEAIIRRLNAMTGCWELYGNAAKRTSKLGRRLKLW